MNPYETLGIDPTASPEDVDKAYKRKAKEVHPDRNGGDSEKFLEVQKCYDLLSNSEARKRFDRTGDWTDNKPDNTDGRMMDIVSGVLEAAMTSCVDVTKTNLIDSMCRIIGDDIRTTGQTIRTVWSFRKKGLVCGSVTVSENSDKG